MIPLLLLVAAALPALPFARVQGEPGAWADYELREPRRAPVLFRVQLLAPEKPGDPRRLEIVRRGAPPELVLQFDLAPSGEPAAARLQIAGGAPLELSNDLLPPPPSSAPAPSAAGARARLRLAGRNFSVHREERSGWILWRSDDLPIWGLARAVSGPRSFSLRAYGRTGARSRLAPQGNGSESEKK